MGTDYPPLPPASQEAQMNALRNFIFALNARVEQLSLDVHTSFQQSVSYQEQRFSQIETQLSEMKHEILEAFSGLLTIIDSRLPPVPGAPGAGQKEEK